MKQVVIVIGQAGVVAVLLLLGLFLYVTRKASQAQAPQEPPQAPPRRGQGPPPAVLPDAARARRQGREPMGFRGPEAD